MLVTSAASAGHPVGLPLATTRWVATGRARTDVPGARICDAPHCWRDRICPATEVRSLGGERAGVAACGWERQRGDHRRRGREGRHRRGRDRSTERGVSSEPAPSSKHTMPTFGETHVSRLARGEPCLWVGASILASVAGVAPCVRKRLRHGWSSQPWLAADARNLSGREPHRGRPAVLLPPHPWPRSFGQRGLARGQIRALGRRGRCFGVAVATADGVPSLGTELGLTERRWRGAARGSRGGAMFSAVIARLW
jgi:hypothetical protein